MKAWGIASAAVLALLPAAALFWQGEFGRVSAAPTAASVPAAVVSPALAGTAAPPPLVSPAPAGATTAPPAVSPTAPNTAVPSPVVVPAPASPASDWAKAPLLEAAVNKAMANFPGRYSVVVQELSSGKRWAARPDDLYHPASTIKLVVSLYALEQYRAGKLGWQDAITYTRADYESPGGGALEQAPFGSQYPVENLVNRALQYSNNIAVNMLGRYLGWENVRQWSRTIHADLYRGDDGLPQVTAMSELGWWLHLNRLSGADPKSAELLLAPLRSVAYTGRIPAGLPDSVRYLHKFGSYNGYFHDGGIVYAKEPYVLVVLTQGATEDQADAAIASLSAAVYSVMSN